MAQFLSLLEARLLSLPELKHTWHELGEGGFPVYDYDPSSLQEALSASVAKVNSQSLSPYLFRATRSSLKRVNVLDEDTLVMNLEFSVQETTCLRDSGDSSTCAFQRGYSVPTAACRSTVQMSKGQVKDVWAHCRWASTSESNSSEEMIFGDMARSHRRRNDYLLGFLSDESKSEQFHDRSLETMRRGHPPAHRRFLNLHRRARINSGFE
uniref:secreted phosphoprotein 24 isoform X1 n=1 Tax=Arvicanthis niloticus TaxID=61156 RepID=UPI0014863DAB|nr:secreted phosphoprotein 24 isoform X1 [Arvicanthis niloticus]